MGANQGLSVYQQVLGHGFFKMPTVFRKMHGPQQPTHAEGQMEVIYGKSILAKICTPFMPIPPQGKHTLTLDIEPHKKGELWIRKFPTKTMTSIQYIRNGRLYEQFGWSHFEFDLRLSDETLLFICKKQYFGFIRLPNFLSVIPYATATELDYNTWEMDVSMHLWGVLLAQYKGEMRAKAGAENPISINNN